MQGRQPSLYSNSSVFFESEFDDIRALQTSTLESYCETVANFSDILSLLHEKELFTHISATPYEMGHFLQTYFPVANQNLTVTPVDLIATPLAIAVEEEGRFLAKECDSLALLVDCYLGIIMDVLNNKLAQKPYEKRCDQENVTEREHALQAGKIAYLLGMRLTDILALLLHDIARPSIADPSYGHANHCKEGRAILSPLGLTVDYSGYHAFAKFLLSQFCPAYKNLISNVSKYTLNIQKSTLFDEAKGLSHLHSQQLAHTFFQIMFMRLIDDMSKVPEKLLTKKGASYFDDALILSMLKKQIVAHMHTEMDNSKDKGATLAAMKEKLEGALSLLLRAKAHSHHPELYEKYKDICDPLVSETKEGLTCS